MVSLSLFRRVLLVVGCLAALRAGARDAEFEGNVTANVMVPMRDGVKLATDVYRPARQGKPVDGRFPIILSRTPYNKSVNPITRLDVAGRFYAERGYVFVAQDTRGRYASEGVWHMLTDDVADGRDTAAWIARQPWSGGKIGMYGTSYVGGTQHAMALD